MPSIPYLDYDAATDTFEEKSCTAFSTVTSDTTTFEDDGWYVVDRDVVMTGHNIVVDGAAHLILCDGASLTISGLANNLAGIQVGSGNALTIYGQTAGSGALTVTGGKYGAAIGGNYGCANGAITINGGNLSMTGGSGASGIGTGYLPSGTCDQITINGGTVVASSIDSTGAAGIGTGRGAEGGGYTGGDILITGGKVSALARGGSADIGGGDYCTGGNIRIAGGTYLGSGGRASLGGGQRNCVCLWGSESPNWWFGGSENGKICGIR